MLHCVRFRWRIFAHFCSHTQHITVTTTLAGSSKKISSRGTRGKHLWSKDGARWKVYAYQVISLSSAFILSARLHLEADYLRKSSGELCARIGRSTYWVDCRGFTTGPRPVERLGVTAPSNRYSIDLSTCQHRIHGSSPYQGPTATIDAGTETEPSTVLVDATMVSMERGPLDLEPCYRRRSTFVI